MFETHFSKFQVSSGNIYFYKDVTLPNNFYPELPYIFRALLYREKINMNTFVLIVGNPRTSKSYCAMKIAEVVEEKKGKKFNVDDQLTFGDVKKFLIWSQTATNSIFILDETGTSLSPDLFWSLQQRVMRRFIQTQGFRKNTLIWVLPSVVFIQKGFRFMSNYAIRTLNQGLVEVHKIVVNQLIGKGFPDRIETMKFNFPDQEIVERYEQLKKEWNDKELESDVNFLDDLEKPYEKKFGVETYLNAFRNLAIDGMQLKDHLTQLNYKKDDIDIIIQSEQNKLRNNPKIIIDDDIDVTS
jgi:hypothetical protein